MTIAFALLLMCIFCALVGIYRGIANYRETRRREEQGKQDTGAQTQLDSVQSNVLRTGTDEPKTLP